MKDGRISVKRVKVPGSRSSDAVEIKIDNKPAILVKAYSSEQPSAFGGGRLTVRTHGDLVSRTHNGDGINAFRFQGPAVKLPDPEPFEAISAPEEDWQ